MCGRFTLTVEDVARLAREWGAEVDEALAARWRPRFNIAPGHGHVVLQQAGDRRALAEARFGLTGPAGLVVNARVETAASRPTFREAWRARRAVVPADGFYEWEGPAAARRPSWFHLPGRRPFLVAALLGPAPGGGVGFAILTTAARAPVAALHDRMPVIVPEASLAAWLAGDGPPLPAPGDGALVARAVSPRVNAVEHDDPQCLAPADPPRQGTLF